MMVVLSMAAVLWGVGVAMGTPKGPRFVMLGVLFAGVIVIQLALPNNHPMREATGGDVRLWLLIFAFIAVIVGYRSVLRRLRHRAIGVEPQPLKFTTFSETELDRYARHIVLREIGGVGQKALRDAKVLVIGAGGLGSPALQYLAAAGVGTIGVIDDDIVENANLQRQVIHTDRKIGEPKAQSALDAMTAQNPFVDVRSYHRRLTADMAAGLFTDYDIILDGCDNFQTRYLVNDTAVALKKPLISAALTQWEGQISVYDPANGAPCYACIFPTAPDANLVPSCAEAGVLGPLPGVIGAMMAAEAVKVITKAGTPLHGRILMYDALNAETRIISAKRDPQCKTCGSAP